MTQDKDRRRHGQPDPADVTPATTTDAVVQPDRDLREELPDSDIITEDQAGMSGGAHGSSGGGSGMKGHPDAIDPD
ncbi:hypothetical protein HC031_26180 [Planosporangium thailandense]|uniref:Uncharacterized protein n=1 Tax=Planosporangium thailandense TaxID=765197 RepID=A0ABX0Y6K0_9ACTN|nr:hypothetical protein [Planosporangium thailandense]NJC73180.1 hypothetical protein [Planosporangium thailandense]